MSLHGEVDILPKIVTAAAYRAWLAYVFDQPTTPDGWFNDLDVPPFAASPREILALFTQTCQQAGADLLGTYADAQLVDGLRFLLNTACSDTVLLLKDPALPLSERLAAIRSLGDLYAGFFARRCQPVWGLGRSFATPLNEVCFMLWDAANLTFPNADPEGEASTAVALQVLAATLRQGHPACVESALHGLGHLHLGAPQAVADCIADWLAGAGELPDAVQRYAAAASTGMVA